MTGEEVEIEMAVKDLGGAEEKVDPEAEIGLTPGKEVRTEDVIA